MGWCSRGGAVIGLAAAAALTQLMKSVLFGISPVDPLTYTAVPIVLLQPPSWPVICLRGVQRVDPVETLRAE